LKILNHLMMKIRRFCGFLIAPLITVSRDARTGQKKLTVLIMTLLEKILAMTSKLNYLYNAKDLSGQKRHSGAFPCGRKPMPSPRIGLGMGRAFFYSMPAELNTRISLKKIGERLWRRTAKCLNPIQLCGATSYHDDPSPDKHFPRASGIRGIAQGFKSPGAPSNPDRFPCKNWMVLSEA